MKLYFCMLKALILTTLIAGEMTYANDPFNPVIGGVPVYCSTAGTGQRVAFVPNQNLNDIGRARPGNPPTIELNPMLLARLPSSLQLFWYGHECAHHVLGHTIGSYSPSSESEADCWSIQTLKEQGLATRRDVEQFAQYFRNNPGSQWGHLPGPQRTRQFLACYDQVAENTENSCRYAHDGECDEPGLCDRGTDTADCTRHRSEDVADLPNYCCTQAGRLGPYPNPGDVREGDACYGTHPFYGRVTGLACF